MIYCWATTSIVPLLYVLHSQSSIRTWYRIAGNFRGRKLSWNLVKKTIFAEKTFADCLLLLCQRTPRPQILWRKLSQIATKPRNLWKFSPSKVFRYTILNALVTITWQPLSLFVYSVLWWVLPSVQERVITQVVTEPVCFTLHCMDHFPLGCQVAWLQLVAMVTCWYYIQSLVANIHSLAAADWLLV